MNKVTNPNIYVNIKIGKTRFLIPESELLSIVTGDQTDLDIDENAHRSTINIGDKELAVYMADENMNLVSGINNKWNKCICLDDGKLEFGIICDDASVINPSSPSYYDLPGCMENGPGPVYGLTVYNDTIYCNTNTARLYNLIEKNHQS